MPMVSRFLGAWRLPDWTPGDGVVKPNREQFLVGGVDLGSSSSEEWDLPGKPPDAYRTYPELRNPRRRIANVNWRYALVQ
jgi:hypothetical protein